MTETLPLPTDERAFGPAFMNGMRCRCPRCGRGRLFTSYLKVAPRCEVCDLDLSQHQADDAPPYFTIFLVGHLVIPALLAVQMATDWPMWTHMVLWPSLALILCIVCLPPVKGMVLAYQWAMKMHGFADEPHDEHHD